MKKYFILFITILLISVNAHSQYNQDKIFAQLKSQYSKLMSVSLNFSLNDNNNIKGQLTAKRGNKYILTIGNRKIYCDGSNIWNYVPENKNVLLSKFDSHGESASIEKIFFEFTKNFKPKKLYKSTQSESGLVYVLELVPNGTSKDDITMIKLYINPENFDIYSLDIVRNYAEESWGISNLKLNPEIADNKFIFKAPENTEIIDLR